MWMRRVLISTKPFIFVLFPVGVTVRSAESLSSAIPLGTSTERANSKKENHGRSHLFQDAVSSVSFWLRSFSVCNRPPSPEPSRLDDWFLGAGRGSQPRPAPVPFFPEVHEELTSLWMAPFTARSPSSASSVLTTLDGGVARGYAGIPQVERAVAVHLCPRNAATWRNRPRLPSKACKLTAALAAKAYSAAGQTASALHAMAILQVHQAKALKQVHEGSTDPRLMQELRTATDFALRATKDTARSLGKAMSTMAVQERHL